MQKYLQGQHHHNSGGCEIPDEFELKLARASRLSQYLTERLDDMGAELDRLKAAIEPMKSASQAETKVLVDLADRYQRAKNNPAEIDAITAEIKANTQSVVDATLANTPAEESR